MFSVMYTGMNFLPLCTARVCPMNSGRIVERRDHVRTTFFSFLSFMSTTFFSRWSSVNGPFFSDLLMKLIPLLLHVPARNDELIRPLDVARLEAARGLAPRRHRMPAPAGFAFAAAVRMIHRVHRNAAVVRALAQPARLPRLAVRFVFMVDIAHLADGGHALHRHAPHFARRQFQQRHAAFSRNQLRLRARRTGHLPALARTQLDIVNHGAGGNVLEWKSVTGKDVGFGAGGDRAPNFEADGSNNVSLLPVDVIQKRDARRA